MIYLQQHPPARTQYRRRRATPSGAIVVHTTENAADIEGLDSRAEQVADWITRRTGPGSYHLLVDSDSWIHLVDFDNEAFGEGTGGNKWAIHLSFACHAHEWDTLPTNWINGAIGQARLALDHADRWFQQHHGHGLRWERINASEYRARQAGFISHAELDPDRRTDPGDQFPWHLLLDHTDTLTTGDTMLADLLAAYRIGGAASGRPHRTPSPAACRTWLADLEAKTARGEPLAPTLLWIIDTVANETNPKDPQ